MNDGRTPCGAEITAWKPHPQLVLKYLELALRLGEKQALARGFPIAAGMLDRLNEKELVRLIALAEPCSERQIVRRCLDRLMDLPKLSFTAVRSLLGQAHRTARPDQWEQACAVLSARLDPADRQQLEILIAHRVHGAPAALRLVRAACPSPRPLAEAARIAQLLIEAADSPRAARYLSAALRVWPDNSELRRLHVTALLRCGRLEAAERCIAEDAPSADPALARLQVQVDMHRGDTETAATRLKGTAAPPNRFFATRQMLRIRLQDGDLVGADAALRELVCLSGSSDRRRTHLSATHEGRLLTELRLGATALAELEPEVGRAAGIEMLAPDFFFVAREIVRTWTERQPAGAIEADPPAGSEIPRQVFQYWDDRDVPADARDIMASWESLKGFSYQRFDRKMAKEFLYGHFGPRYVSALGLARQPAQESDFFRLCVLLAEGGIYADADDRCVASPLPLLRSGPAMIAFRDTPGYDDVANNVLMASKGHRILALAADMAAEALLSRAPESAWFKTGPGLLTRAVACAILQARASGHDVDLRLQPIVELLAYVDRHANLAYKRTGRHWNHDQGSRAASVTESLLVFAQAARPPAGVPQA